MAGGKPSSKAPKGRAAAGGPARGAGRARKRPPALGNDPFTRGAAVRDPFGAAPGPVAAANATAPSAVRPEPFDSAAPGGSARGRPGAADEAARSRGASPPTSAPATTPRRTATPVPRAEPIAHATAVSRAEDIERKVESTLHSLEDRLQELASRAGLASSGGDLRSLLARLLPLLGERLAAAAEAVRILEPPERLERFGLDPRFSERAQPLLDFLYATWWRTEVRAAERVPAAGAAVVVANHAGAVPWDALVLRHAIRRDHPAHRDLRPLLDDRECDLPVFGGAAIRLGAVRSTPENAGALLAAGALVGVFPEGHLAAQRSWRDRYRIQRFGRGGFAKVALRAGVPIVPCAIVGGEEASPTIPRTGIADWLGLRALGLLRLAPAALAPLPSKWTVRFGEPIATRAHGAAAAEDPAAVNELAERTRATIQAMLDEDVAARGSVFL